MARLGIATVARPALMVRLVALVVAAPGAGAGLRRRLTVRRRRRTVLTLLLSLLVIPSFAHADGGDFSLDFIAAGPFTYNHNTLAGTGPGLPQYDGRVIDKNTGVVESLEGGDFACGDKVIYFTQVVTDAGAVGTQNIRITYKFDAAPSGPAGAHFDTPVTAGLNSPDTGNVGTASAALFGSPSVSAGKLTVVVDVTGLEAGDVAIVRVVPTLACTGSGPGGGNLQARIDSAAVTSPTPDAINVGEQTIPLKNVQDIGASNLTITKTPDGGTVSVGNPVVFTITVNSTGTADALLVSLTDTLPAALAPWTVTGTTGSPTCNIAGGNLLTCTKATLVKGTSFSVTVTSANTTAADCGVVNNTASVQATNVSAKNDSGDVTVTGCAADLTITKTPDGGTVPVGSPVVFTITVNSTGNTAAQNVSLTDTLPAALAPWTVTGTTGSPTCNIAGGNLLTCTKATLAAGTSFSVTVTSANTTAADCGAVNNTAFLGTDVLVVSDSGFVTVECPGQITIKEDAIPDDPQVFPFFGSLGNFSLVDGIGGGGGGAAPTHAVRTHTATAIQVFPGLNPGVYVVTQAAPAGWPLVAITCTGGGTAVNLGAATVTINLSGGTNVTCVFVNVRAVTPPPPPPPIVEPPAPAPVVEQPPAPPTQVLPLEEEQPAAETQVLAVAKRKALAVTGQASLRTLLLLAVAFMAAGLVLIFVGRTRDPEIAAVATGDGGSPGTGWPASSTRA